jgi:hypothetical protein
MGAIIGSVADSETGGGIAHATITLRVDGESRALAYARVDTLGGFRFGEVPAGRYLLSARGLTYPETRVHLDVKASVLDTAHIALRFDPLYLSCMTVITS